MPHPRKLPQRLELCRPDYETGAYPVVGACRRAALPMLPEELTRYSRITAHGRATNLGADDEIRTHDLSRTRGVL